MISKNTALIQQIKMVTVFILLLGSFFLFSVSQVQAAQVLTVQLNSGDGSPIKIDQYGVLNLATNFVMSASLGSIGTTSITALDLEWFDSIGRLQKCNNGSGLLEGRVSGPGGIYGNDGCLKGLVDINEINTSVSFTPFLVGTYKIQVKATDSLGNVVTSAPINLFVVEDAATLARLQANAALLEKIKELTQTVLLLQEKLNVQNGIGVSIFSDFMGIGYENESVTLLQKVLASNPLIYPEGLVTGYFGQLTENALVRFQQAFGLQTKNGLFTIETRKILTEALTQFPFDTTPPPYLTNPGVVGAINTAKIEFSLIDLVESGQVTFSRIPNLSIGSFGADIATLQRILATDPSIYPEQKITGSYTPDVVLAVKRLQKRYTLLETGSVDITTLDLLKAILGVNYAPTIADDLLLKNNVQPGALKMNDSRKIISIQAVRDAKETEVIVSVIYDNAFKDVFSLYPVNSPLVKNLVETDLIDDLAKRLNRDIKEIKPVLSYATAEKIIYPKLANIYVALDDTISIIFIEDNKKQVEFVFPEDIDLTEKIEFNKKVITVGEVRDYIIGQARIDAVVHPTIKDAVKQAIASYYLVDVKEVPNFPIIYTHEIAVNNIP